MNDLPLGKPSSYTERYSPKLLRAIPRAESRGAFGLAPPLPFSGTDVWNAWELTWLDADGSPRVAVATLRVDARSPNIVESKSLKLYLNSFANERSASRHALASTLSRDLGAIVGAEVDVRIDALPDARTEIAPPPGVCVDDEAANDFPGAVDPTVLSAAGPAVVDEALHSHLLRSLCPVTAQPDTGSVLIRYRGPAIDRAGLLRYLVSYRNHEDFHEACTERIFVDLKVRCGCELLSVYARYNRRGGIDINPFRSDFETEPGNARLWRQ